MRIFLPLATAIVCMDGALAQPAPTRETAPLTTRTMASLIAEGYETQTVQIFKDKIWMRKGAGEGLAFVCDRGRIGSPAFDAYREKRYDEIICSVPPP